MTSKNDVWKPIRDEDDMETDQKRKELDPVLVEIVSALRVPSMDARSDSDPYVIVSVGGKEIHRTNVLHNNPNPIWTIDNGSLFLLDLQKGLEGKSNTVNLKTAKVTFTLKDYDATQRDATLGTVEIKLKDLIKGKGKRKEYSMNVPQEVQEFNKKRRHRVTKKAKLVLRFKPPSVEELHFVKTIQDKAHGVFSSETYLPPSKSSGFSKNGAPDLTGWGAQLMGTADDDGDVILQEALEPSSQWIDVLGSGNTGRVFLEVIACDGLPNFDSPTLMNPSNSTDPFCCIILEDSVVNTSFIKDSLSPRWMPNDRRAFILHAQHPSSQIHIGVFDHDKTNRPGASLRQHVHDPIGRVLINLTQLRPGTLYTLKYHLYLINDESKKHREEQTHNGTITLRLRVEWGGTECHGNEMKNMIVAGMLPPPASYISVPTKYDFQTAYYTVEGDHDASKFNLTTLTGYLEELEGYVDEEVIGLVYDAILTVLLWRGNFPISCCGKTIVKLPLHSIVAFTWGILVTQNYNRLISFLLFAFGWVLFATMEYRRQHPSPWHKCVSYAEMLGALLSGCCCGCFGSYGTLGSETIAPNENLHDIQSYYEAVKERKDMKTKQKEQAAQRAAQMEEEALKHDVDDSANMGLSIAMATKKSDTFISAMNPLRPILHPVQKILDFIVVKIRIAKSILLWEENYYPFWIVTGSFWASLLVFFIPWGWICRWAIRVVVWIVLGPWMKLLDWLYFVRVDKLTPEERKEIARQKLHDKYEQTLAEHLISQKRKEQVVKLKSMMKYLFGKFVLRVPRFREARFQDYPLPASTAEPFASDTKVTIVGQICGQTLTGDMIPTRMTLEHPFTMQADGDDSFPAATRVLANRAGEGESKPLLFKASNENKSKFYGVFGK